MLNFVFTKTPLAFLIQSFWRDEAFSYLLAKKNVLAIISLTAKDFNPPFYYLTLHFWIKMFGSSEIAIRSLSYIFYWASIYLCFLFLNRILKINIKKSLVYLVLFITNPIFIYYAFEGRMYAMFLFFSLLSFYFFIRKNYKWYFISTILGLYTHYFMILVVFIQWFYVLYYQPLKQKKEKFFKHFRLLFYSFLPWLIFVLLNNSLIKQTFWIEKPSLKMIINFPAIIYTGYERGWGQDSKHFSLISLFIVISMLLVFYKKNKKSNQKSVLLLFFLWFFLPNLLILLISFIKPLFLSRYLIFTTPPIIFLIIFLLESLSKKTKIFLFFLVLFFNLNYNAYQTTYRKKTDISKVVNQIKPLLNNQDSIYVTDPLNFHTAQYYFDEKKVYIYGKPYDEIPNYVGKILIPKKRIKNVLPKYPKKAFIIKDDLTYNIQAAY